MAADLRFRTASHPFPVGTEYYRAPMPPQEFWQEDFAAIRESGLKIIRTFSYWNWIEPASGKFELDDFDRFFDLAAENGLLVWFDLTLATHGSCPEWLLREHPDIHQVRPDGVRVYPSSSNASPQGRQVHCYDHPKWREFGERLLSTVVGRYRDHEALLIWGVWDGANFPKTDGNVAPCYCANTLSKYSGWLQKRYTLETLNKRLHRRYRCWEDVVPARSSRNVLEMLLYRQFHIENLIETLRWQVDIIRGIDDKHELRSHGAHFPRPFDEGCATEVDSWGISMPSNELLTGDDPHKIAERCFSFDWSRSIGRGSRWWNEEIYAGMSPAGVTWKTQSHPAEVAMLLWMSLAYGAAGAMFWQYTPEYLSFEAPGYSLTTPDREPTPRLHAVREAIDCIDRVAEHLPLTLPRSEVAIVYSGNSNEVFLFGDEHQRYIDEILGVYRTFWSHSIPVDVVTPAQDWSSYRLIWLPNTALLEGPTVDAIINVVEQPDGPCVLASGNLGSYAESGRYSYKPPEGLTHALGVRIADYDRFSPDQGGGLLSGRFGHQVVSNRVDYASLEPMTGSCAHVMLDGTVVGVERKDHRLSWISLSLATAFGGNLPASLLSQLLACYEIESPFSIDQDGIIALRRLSPSGRWILFLFNIFLRPVTTRIQPKWRIARAVDLLENAEIETNEGSFDISFGPGSVKVVAVD